MLEQIEDDARIADVRLATAWILHNDAEVTRCSGPAARLRLEKAA
jgi:hypothetical protein